MGLRYEAWSTPWDPTGFRRKVSMLPVVEGTGRGSIGFLSLGNDGSADISLANFDRLDELVSDTESSLISVYDCQPNGVNTLIDEWILDRVPQRLVPDKRVSLAGPSLLKEALDKALVYAFDYPKSPSVTRDHIWGKNEDDDSTGLIRNGTFEDVPMPNGGFEDGNAGFWQGTENDDGSIGNGAITAINSATDARSGSWYGLANPAEQGGGARRSISGLVPGENYTITGWINETSGSGDRLRAGIIGASTASHTNAYREPTDPEEPGIWWAEIGNASQGNGASTGAWQSVTLTFKPESDAVELVIIYDDVNDRSFRIDDWAISGDNVGLEPWFPIQINSVVALGGGINVVRHSTTHAHNGAGSCQLQGVDGPFYDPFGRIGYGTFGISQEVRLVPGRLYTMTAWVRHNGTGTNGANELMRIVLNRRTPKGHVVKTVTGDFRPGPGSYYMAAKTISVPANTWTKIQMTVYADVSDVWAEVRYAGTNARNQDLGLFTSPTIWIDDVSIHEGLPATTIGDIWQMLLNDCTVSHADDTRGTVLDWIDYSSFDAVNDSNGNPWNENIPFLARWGSTMGHVLDDTYNRGYEAELVRKATPSGGKTHDFHLYNPGGRDDAPNVGINTAQPTLGGESLFRSPAYTATLVASPDGAYTEDFDATALANFGRLETFMLDSEASGPVSRQLLADNLLNYEEANRQAVRFELAEAPNVPRPFVDYRPGDTISMAQPPGLPKEDRRVQRIDYVNLQPTQYVVVGSRIVEGEAAAFDLVERMWRRLNRPGEFNDPDLGVGGGEGVAFVIDVAAADAPSWEKLNARYICDGVDDHVEIQAALDENFFEGTEQSEVQLSSGRFHVDLGWIQISESIHLRGMGKFATVFVNQQQGSSSDTPNFTGDYMILVGQDGQLSEVGFNTFLSAGSEFKGTCVVSDYGTVHDITHINGHAHIFVYFRGTINPSSNLRSWGDYDKAMLLFDENWIELNGVFHSGAGTTLWFDVAVWGNGTVSNVHIDSVGAHAIVLEEVGNVNISNVNVATGPPFSSNDWAAIHISGSPGPMNFSNFNLESVGYFVLAPDQGGLLDMTIDNVIGKVWHSVVSFPTRYSARYLGVHNIKLNCGDDDAFRLDLAPDSLVQVSDFFLDNVQGSGFHITRGFGTNPIRVNIYDGTIEANQHGILLDAVGGNIHDVAVRAGLGAANTYDAFHLNGSIIQPRLHNNDILNAAQLRYGINIADAGVVRAIVVGNSGGDPSDFGTDALNDAGTDTQLVYPDDPTYGDNFFRSGSTSGADQSVPVSSTFDTAGRDFEQARPVTPVQS